MSNEAIGTLIDRWINDSAFREALRSDPEGTVRRAGITLEEEEWAALRAVDWSLPDEQLQARVSNAWG